MNDADQNEAAVLAEKRKTPCCGYEWSLDGDDPKGPIFWNPFNGVVQCHNCGETFSAYKQALPAAPGDWVLVPREPTQEMLDAVDSHVVGCCNATDKDATEIWQAMWDAAPPAPLASTVAAPGVPEIEALREFARYVIRESCFEGATLDGGDAQEAAAGLGLIVATKYDPARHGENDVGAEPGADWWEFGPALKAAPTPVAASGPTLGSEDGLLPCPFCGSKVHMKIVEDAEFGFINCPKGSACDGSYLSTVFEVAHKEAAIKQWNTRVAPTSAGPSLVAAETGLDAVARLATWTKVSFRGVTGSEVKVRFPSQALADVFENAIRTAARLTPQGEAQEKK